MVGQIEVHWTERDQNHFEAFDSDQEEAANSKFEELKDSNNRMISDIRLVKVERFASVGW